ncbi:MAG: N(4)-(beta-N-acetylglucosaminyl)-L-asparaginase [Planctomycetota bacterium]
MAAASAVAVAPACATARTVPRTGRVALPVVISSGNGWHDNAKQEKPRASAVEVAHRMLLAPEVQALKYGMLEAVVAGVGVVEDDPEDISVGLGGLPNEEGVVQLDSSVMFGPTHQAGAVGALENIQNPARVAMYVLRQTDHSFIVGEGAYRFARAMGLPHRELLTENSRKIWLAWKQTMSDQDDWLPPSAEELDPELLNQFTHGTIHLSALSAGGDLAAVTTTSGLSFKIPGRVGDSPIVGAGMFCDNEVGSAGATGRGEEAIVNCGAFSVVEAMRRDQDPEAACMEVLKRVATKARLRGLFQDGKPDFQLTFYAVRKDGAYGSAAMKEGAGFAVSNGDVVAGRHEPCGWLFDE